MINENPFLYIPPQEGDDTMLFINLLQVVRAEYTHDEVRLHMAVGDPLTIRGSAGIGPVLRLLGEHSVSLDGTPLGPKLSEALRKRSKSES